MSKYDSAYFLEFADGLIKELRGENAQLRADLEAAQFRLRKLETVVEIAKLAYEHNQLSDMDNGYLKKLALEIMKLYHPKDYQEYRQQSGQV